MYTGPTGYGDDIINGAGTTEPRGLLPDAATGVTRPAGTGTTLGTQGTANQGTDALRNLVRSVAEPYASAPISAFVLCNASDIIVRKLRDTTRRPVQGFGERGRILGFPSNLDPFMPAMANTAESIAFGDMSEHFPRIANGVRFERSDEFRFQNDLVAFRCILCRDGALVDTGAVKTFVNTTLAASRVAVPQRQDRALFNVGNTWPGPSTIVRGPGQRRHSTTLSRRLVLRQVGRRCGVRVPVHVYDGDRRQVDPARAFVTPAAGNLPDWLWQHLVSFLLRGKVRGMIADRGHAARSD